MRLVFAAIILSFGFFADAHPLEQVLRDISKMRVDLAKVRDENTGDQWLQTKVDQLAKRLAVQWTDTIVLPLEKNDLIMSELGYSYSVDDQPWKSSEIQKNEKATQLDNDQNEFNPDRWKQLALATNEQIKNLIEARNLFHNSEYVGGFSPQELYAVGKRLYDPQLDTLKSLKLSSENVVNCLSSLKTVSLQYGLVVSVANGQASWTFDDLNRVHGSTSVEAMSDDERFKVRIEIGEMLKIANSYSFACPSKTGLKFMLSEYAKLRGVSK